MTGRTHETGLESTLAENSIASSEHSPLESLTATLAVKTTIDPVLSPLELILGEGDAEIARLAVRQRGLIHRSQLQALNLTQHQIHWRLKTQRLAKICRSVYAVGYARPVGPLVDETIATMRFDGLGVLSHLSAARLWGITDLEPEGVQMTLVGVKHRTAPAGVTLAHVRSMDPSDLRRLQGLPVTSPARTWVDMTASCSVEECESALAIIRARKLCRDRQIWDVIERAAPNKAGIGVARKLLADRSPGADTRSMRERKLLSLIEQAELARPLTNVKIEGHLVDCYWPEYGLVVEFDSWQFHQSRASFEEDRRRDQNLTAAGLTVQRVTARHMDERPLAIVARLAAAIARCASSRRALALVAGQDAPLTPLAMAQVTAG